MGLSSGDSGSEARLSSPEYLRTSLAAAMVLGVRPGRFYRDIKLGCINLLLTYPDGCRANCAYCGLSRSRPGDFGRKSFIRVDWPTLATEEVLDRMVSRQSDIRRVCLSMVTHPRAYADTATLAEIILGRVHRPLSVLIAPSLSDRDHLRELRSIGVDIIGIGLDAASEQVFERTRGKGVRSPLSPLSWKRYWHIVEASRELFGPFKVNVHLMVGIGESDRELVEMLRRLRDMQVAAYLFPFYPEEGSRMARRRRPSLVRVRRLQLAKHLIEEERMGIERIGFDGRGRITRLELPVAILDGAISSGIPFLSGGCPDRDGDLVCTRPFGSYRPGEPFRDFPFLPDEEDLVKVRRELSLPGLLS